MREAVQEILEETFNGATAYYNVRLSESVAARLHYVIQTRAGERVPDYDVREIEARLVEATRSWVDDLLAALVEQLGEEHGTELFASYRDAFPPGYRATSAGGGPPTSSAWSASTRRATWR